MNFKQRIIGIQKWIDQKGYLDENQFDKNQLFEQKYLNFQIDDCYNYPDLIDGKLREDIFGVLYSTYLNWREKLLELDMSFYLGVWIYNPRLPKSEVVCAIGYEKIEYYKNNCFEVSTQQTGIIDLKDFEKEQNTLIWKEKIDFDILEDWEINFPKENYESEQQWIEFQKHYKNFINESFRIEKGEKGFRYFKNVGEIWTGELIKE